MKTDTATRFWALVASSTPTQCWLWRGSVIRSRRSSRGGHGQFSLQGKIKKAHRVAWELWHRSTLPDGATVRQTCGEKLCCNPSHLVVTAPLASNPGRIPIRPSGDEDADPSDAIRPGQVLQ